ncbi:MAG: hypothetical protein ACE5HA_13905 [Anaerolineae bacterium]
MNSSAVTVQYRARPVSEAVFSPAITGDDSMDFLTDGGASKILGI